VSPVEEIFAGVFKQLHPRTHLVEVRVEFRPFANVNSNIRLNEGRLVARLSDMLEKAPARVLEALAYILISKLYRQAPPARYQQRYQRFLNRGEVRRQLLLVRQARGRKQAGSPQGETCNLEEVFEALNARYFHGLLGMPVLGWSRTPSRVQLGHFDPSHNTMVISRLFDSPEVPRYVLEYLLYHEMLHLRYPVEHCGNRRRLHSADFKRDERRFEHYEQARRALSRLL
jgi:hypothetical protein